MITKLPIADNQMTSPGAGSGADSGGRRAVDRASHERERGIALVSVVAVLVLLAIVSTPFLVSMRDSAARGQKFLYSARADWEAESLFERVRSHLTLSLEHIERRKLDDSSAGAVDSGRPPDDATPTSDTTAEITLPRAILDEFNIDSAREQRVWDVEIVDLQGRLNANNCSYPVLANILGRTELGDQLSSDDNRVPLVDGSMFPADGGVVRIGTEAIKYEQRLGNELSGCERGYRGDVAGNSAAGDWDQGDVVILEAAYQIATRPFRARPGAYVRYTNIYQLRSIADQGVAALSPEQFDSLRPFVTTWNGNIVGDGWSNPQVVRNAITAADSSQRYADLKNNRYFGEGTIFRITDGVNDDYGVITKVRGDSQVLLGGNIENDYSADQSRMYSLARSPVNVNVADEDLLAIVFSGLKMRGRGTAIPPEKARRIAKHLKEWVVSDEDAPGVYRNWEDFTNALEAARDEMGIISGDEFEALLRNAMNANDSGLSFSTVPFVFRSFDLYQVDATAAIMDSTGRELARRELSRVFHASSTRSGTFVVETQDDFQRHIMKSRDSKWFATFPDNINAYYDSRNIPASEYEAFATKSRFPSTKRSDADGDVRLLPAAYRFSPQGTAQGTTERVHHFDESDLPDGLDLAKDELTFTVDGPYSVEDRQADIVDLQDIPGVGSGIEMGLKEFAYSMWYRPAWSRSGSDEVLFDYGAEGDDFNRVSLRYDGERDVLLLAVADATREGRSCEIFYEFDHTTWDADQWYHIGVNVAGCHPSLIELFIDGEKQGRASGITRLTSNIAPTGAVLELSVEDASSFPDYGVVMIRAEEGMELFEYSSRTEGSFILSKRKARNIDVVDEADEPRTHVSGAVVELYGFAGSLLSDIKRGGSTTDSTFGPFRIYRFHYYGQDVMIDDGTIICHGLAATTQHVLPIADITLTEWDTGSADQDILDDLGPTGTEGLALIVSRSPVRIIPTGGTTIIIGNGGSLAVGSGDLQSGTFTGSELVAYRVTDPGTVEITQRNLDSQHVQFEPNGQDANPRFIPGYSWADDQASSAPENMLLNTTTDFGVKTAFIPVALIAQGTGEYLNPLDEEPQLGGFAYAQVDGEWIKYDTYDDQILPGKIAFYRDMRWDDISARLGSATLSTAQATAQASTGAAGGSGGNSNGATEPPRATDLNDENNLPPEPQAGTAPNGTGVNGAAKDWRIPEETAFELAQDADFRGMLLPNQQNELRIANTIPAEHAAGVEILPCFFVVAGNDLATGDIRRGANPGFDDLITLRDANLNDEHVRVQWGYRGWAGLTQITTQTWNWDRPQQVRHLRSFDSRMWTRALKFPSRELPDAGLTTGEELMRVGAPYNNPGVTSAAVVDEAWFAGFDTIDPGRAKYAFLGEVPPELFPTFTAPASGTAPDPRFNAIDDQVDEFAVNFPYFDEVQLATIVNGLPIDENLYDDDGGVIRIDDELIIYSEFDPNNGLFSGCVRGSFGTEALPHGFGAIVGPVRTFATSALVSDADESSAAFDLVDATDFPDDGYIRIGDSLELIGYTERGANTLSGPLGRIDPTTERAPGDADARVGGGLFRGRFGTGDGVRGYSSGEVVVAMPFRHYDRYAEYSDDAELSYTQLTWTKPGAVWKRITWDEDPRQNVEIIALVRFAGGPPWDSADVILVGQGAMPSTDRRKHLYEIADPKAENLLNVESDRCEVRLLIRFVTGAYDRFADVAPDNWKETPRIQKVVVEYVAPPQVLYEDN